MPANSFPYRILLVDDDPSIRQVGEAIVAEAVASLDTTSASPYTTSRGVRALPSSRHGYPSLLDRVVEHVERDADGIALRFPVEGSVQTSTYTWASLLMEVQTLAARFRAAGVQRSDRSAIVSSSAEEQILAFLACMYVGALPAICSFPSPRHAPEAYRIAVESLLDDLQPARILLGTEEAGRLEWMTSKAVSGTLAIERSSEYGLQESGPPAAADVDGVAFLQYSSGTTGFRKCIPVTHGMFARYAFAYNKAMAYGEGDLVVSWLPLYHDMGLIGAFLMPLFWGVGSVHLSPFYWLRRPDIFYRTISALRGSVIYLPNFAFNFSAQRLSPEDASSLDLSCVRAVINGSEPVRAASLQMFAERLRPAGLPTASIRSVYGMAEAVMAVTQSDAALPLRVDLIEKDPFLHSGRAVPSAATGGRHTLAYVSCGRPLEGCRIRIAATSLERVAGEIEVHCDWLFGGYRGAFGPVAADLTEDGWYRSGDVGYLAKGELFVTGRKKDVIVHCGKNIHPSDLEDLLMQSVPGIKPGRAVAFGVEDSEQGTEAIVVMLETQSAPVDAQQVRRAVRSVTLELFGVNVKDIVVCEPDTLKKSTSGKLSRSRNRDLYLAREAASAQQRDEGAIGVHVMLHDIWSDVLQQPFIGLDDLLFVDFGAGSLQTMTALTRINETFGVQLDPSSLMHTQTLRGQAALVGASLRGRVHREPLIHLCKGIEARTPLYLTPGADGHAYNYLRLIKEIDAGRRVNALISPSLDPSHALLGETRQVQLFRDAILADAGYREIVLAGWSYGGLLAYRIAHALAERGKPVRALVIFDIGPDVAAENRLLLRERARLEAHLLDREDQAVASLPRWFREMIAATLSYSPTDRLIMGVRNDTSLHEVRRLARLVLRGHARELEAGGPRETGFELLERLCGEIEALDGERFRQTLLSGSGGEHLHRAALVFKENIYNACAFKADWVFPGAMHVFSQPGSPFAAQWQRLSSQAVNAHAYPFQALRSKSAHASIMDMENVRLFAADLNEVLQQYD